MSRPQSADYDKRRQLILDTAAELIAREGFHGTSVNDIASACGISKSLIYHYYSSKDDILFASMDDYMRELWEVIDEADDTSANPEERFRTILHAILHNYEHAGAKHRVLLQELRRLPADRQKAIVEVEDKVVGRVADIIATIAGTPADKTKTRTAMAMLLMGMVNWTHTWFDPKGPINTDQLADMAADIFLGGVKHDQAD